MWCATCNDTALPSSADANVDRPCIVNVGAQDIEGFHQVRSVSRWLDLVKQDYVRIGPAQKGPKLPLLGGKCITRDIPGQDSYAGVRYLRLVGDAARAENRKNASDQSTSLFAGYQAIWNPRLNITPCGSVVPSILTVSSADAISRLTNLNAVTPIPT